MNTFTKITGFCKMVKNSAKNFKTFDAFYRFAYSSFTYKNLGMKTNEFERLVQVASVEANLI